MMPTVAMPRIPRQTTTATTIRMILRALLPPVAGGAGRGLVMTGAGGAAVAAPHLLQNFVPSVRAAPQELQNAINHLVGGEVSARRASIPQNVRTRRTSTTGLKPILILPSVTRP